MNLPFSMTILGSEETAGLENKELYNSKNFGLTITSTGTTTVPDTMTRSWDAGCKWIRQTNFIARMCIVIMTR